MPDPAHSNTAPRRDILPANLAHWRSYECGPQDDPHDLTWLPLWSRLQPLLSVRGYTLWEKEWGFSLISPSDRGPSPNGFLYHTPTISDSYQSLHYVTPTNANVIAARHNDGRDVMIRIITADGEGHDTLRIVKKVLFEYNDLTFGVFPLVAVSLTRSINSWPKNTVEDIMDMLMQAIEVKFPLDEPPHANLCPLKGIVFLHERHRIAHRDLFLSNFLLEWHPNTLDPDVKRHGFTRPRVYLIDFETAVDFPEDSTPEERVVTGYPFSLDSYGRPVAPEFQVSGTYDPFALDIWQFGSDLTRFRSTIWEIDESTRNEDPRSRPTAAELLDRLDAVVSGIPPALLRKKLVELPEEPYVMSDSLYRRLESNGKRLEAEANKERMG
ncbi:uncharacterized protein ARMOST_16263 [Armillaria ostoyae]|uniref:Protein kinase domain-containing protein n=1 Tax=Armillaria ostoyae TaxID=47428 RepID=A0A284RVR5_ARMOS|nr:uncharacterized protein ARMOST_16263 [Armillaria ostoyae]